MKSSQPDGLRSKRGREDDSFDEWLQWSERRRRAIACRERPITARLLKIPDIYNGNGKLLPYTDQDGTVFPLDHIRELIPSANRHLRSCNAGRPFKTFYADHTPQRGAPPDGVHVFDGPHEIGPGLEHDALIDIDILFHSPEFVQDKRIHMLKRNPPPSNTILFYNRDQLAPQVTFINAIRILREATPRLAEYIMLYFHAIRNLLGEGHGIMDRCLLTLVHYDSNAGLNPHIDSIHMFQNTIGPIFTVAMGRAEKMLDLLPVMVTDPDAAPVRIYTRPNQIMVMDGVARVMWAHALPWHYPNEQFTVVFKFPELSRKIRSENVRYGEASIDIPYYLASEAWKGSPQPAVQLPRDERCRDEPGAPRVGVQ